jgi:hypothetical protein
MKKNSIGALIIASAIIWGLVMIACSLKLKGTECYDQISLILIGGVISHLILIWGPMGMIFMKKKKEL